MDEPWPLLRDLLAALLLLALAGIALSPWGLRWPPAAAAAGPPPKLGAAHGRVPAAAVPAPG